MGATARRALATLAAVFLIFTAAAGATVTSVLAPSTAHAASYQDWPMFLHDPARTAATTDPKLNVANASSLKLKFAFKTGGPIATSASIVGTTAYVGSWDGYEYAINTSKGTLIWKQFLGITSDPGCNPPSIGITSAAAVVNGVLYVGGGDAYWYALDPATGAILWKVFTGDNSQAGAHYNWSSPLINNGFAYIGVASNCDNPLVQGHLMKVAISGAQQGQVVADYNFVPNGQVGGGIWTTPALDPATNTVFVSSGTLNDYTQTQSQAIVALDANSLSFKSSWQLPFEAAVTDSDWGTTPTLTTDAKGNQLLSVANKNGVLYTFNRNNLAAGPIWQRALAIGGDCPTCGDGTIASGIFANGVLYYAGGHNVVNGHGASGSITAFDPGTGSVLWTRQTEQPIIGSPAYVNGVIAEVEGSTFEVINAANGTLLYSYVLPAGVYGAVSVARSQFYVGAIDSKLYAFGLPGSSASPPADPNCPAGFTCQDIRNPGVAGSEQTTNGALTVTASGAAISGASDQYRFLWEPVTGDTQSSVRIVAQSTQNQQPQAGLMYRQSLDPASPFYAVLAYPNDLADNLPQPDLVMSYRTGFGTNSIQLTKQYPANKPIYVMVQRKANLFSTAISTDGVNYQLVPGSTADLDMPATTLAGLAVDSGATTNTGTATFSNLSVGAPISTTVAPPAPIHPCPASWTCSDINNPNPPGDTTSSSPTSFTLYGTGTGISTGASDSLHYVYQPVSGDQTLSAQVVTQAGAPAAAQEGIMMRASTSPTSPYYSVFLKPGGSATVQWRLFDNVPNKTGKITLPAVTSPAYVQIVRYEDTSLNPPQTFFSAQTSTDGANWTPVLGSTVAIDMGTGYLAGMAATSNSPGVTPAVVYNSVSLSPTSSAPPGVCPSEFSCDDVGSQFTPGNQIYTTPQNSTPQWTVLGGGSDIWGVYDSFRFLSQSFPSSPANSQNGDGTISARVVSQTNPGGPWMKSGVMIRSGSATDPQAPYYGVFVTPQHGVLVQWRSAEASQTNQLAWSPSTTAPVWLLASRYTDTTHNVVYYSAFISTDGVNFSFIPGSTIPLNLPGPLVGGIATDAYSSTMRSTVVVDNYAQLGGSQPPPFICPSAWSCTDIGGALPSGQDQLTNAGVWNEIGGGGDIWAAADSFHFVDQSMPADGTVTAHITSQQATDPWAKAGPMIRASTDPGSPYYAVFVTPGHGIAVQWRTAPGATSNQLAVAGAVPAYLRVARYSNAAGIYFTAYTSTDGTNWTAVPGSTTTLNMSGTLLAGFGITSHNQGTGSAVTLDSVAVASGGSIPPGVCPTGWECADIGAATPAGTQAFSGGTWTIQGGGGDIWSTSDSFRYVWQTLAADGSVSARVVSQTNSSPYAKAGVMIRATSDPASPYYAVYVTPGHGILVQSRDTAGNAAVEEVAIAGATPAYLQVTRSGTTFTASTSADGITWTPIAHSSASLPNLAGSVLRGLAVTSHNTGASSTVTFDSVVAP